MEVSAYVTFVIWILEWCASLCLILVWRVIYGYTGAHTLITAMVWNHLILPYTYLMNTSDNRNLVAGVGWKNVIINCLGILNKRNTSNMATDNSKPDMKSKIFMSLSLMEPNNAH